MSFQLAMNSPWTNSQSETLTRVNTGKSHVITWRHADGKIKEEIVLWFGLYTGQEMYQKEKMMISRFKNQ